MPYDSFRGALAVPRVRTPRPSLSRWHSRLQWAGPGGYKALSSAPRARDTFQLQPEQLGYFPALVWSPGNQQLSQSAFRRLQLGGALRKPWLVSAARRDSRPVLSCPVLSCPVRPPRPPELQLRWSGGKREGVAFVSWSKTETLQRFASWDGP